jgi:hypothetical protein
VTEITREGYCSTCGLPVRQMSDGEIRHVWYEFYWIRPCEKAELTNRQG